MREDDVWSSKDNKMEKYRTDQALFPNPQKPLFTFIDLFAGIGGFRIAMNGVGGKCVFSSEYNVDAQKTYLHNFGDVPYGDITLDTTKSHIPNYFDVLCAGFPCQAFSIAGYRKGFEDTRGTLFFEVAKIIDQHRPKVVFLENVKNLFTHNNGQTYKTIISTLERLGYVVYSKIINAMEYVNIPQNRERIYIVCFNANSVTNHTEFKFPEKKELSVGIETCIDQDRKDDLFYYNSGHRYYNQLSQVVSSMTTVYQWRRQYVRENKSNVCPTLTANMGTGGHNVPIVLTNYGIRKLTPRECLNFQGYPNNYKFPSIALSKQYMQAGNSVVVPVITLISESIAKVICKSF